MKILAILTGLACAMTSTHAQAVSLLAADGSLGVGVPALVEKFGDATVNLSATFLIAEGATPEIFGDLILSGGELGEPLQSNISFTAAQTQVSPALLQGVFSLPLEKVAKPVDLELDLWLRPQQGPPVAVGKVQLRVYPRDYFQNDIVRYFADSSDDATPHGQLTVFGEADGLRQLLDRWKVMYKDLHSAIPIAIDPGVIAVGISAKKPDPLAPPVLESGASLLWFLPDAEKLPGVYQKVSPDSLISTTNFLPPDDWSGSPFFQRLLLEHIQQTIQLHHSHEN